MRFLGDRESEPAFIWREKMALREAAEKALAALESCTPGDYVIHPWFDERLCDEAKEALRAELARPPEPAAAPDGWQLVPVEPTPGMVAAYLGSNRDYWQIVDEKPTVLGKWRNGTPEEAVAFAYASMLAAAPRPPEPAAHPSTPIDALLQQYADECSDFSGPDGYAFARKIANRYAERGPDCQIRCVVHTLLNPPEPAGGEREPVAWQDEEGGSSFVSHRTRQGNAAFQKLYTVPLFAHPPAAPRFVPDDPC